MHSLQPQVQILDKTALLFKLYQTYCEVRAERGEMTESFDEFLYWGNIILKDFETCDRYLVRTTTSIATSETSRRSPTTSATSPKKPAR